MRIRISLFLGVAIFMLAACTPKTGTQLQTSASEVELRQLADELAHKFIITDGHVDLPYRLQVTNFRLTKEFIGIPINSGEGDFDYDRAKIGGLDAPFMSIYIPASHQETGTAKVFADSLIDLVKGVAGAHPGKFAVVATPEEVEMNFKKGIISLPMGMENGAPVMDDLSNLGYFRQRGISYITLTHSLDNQICDSSYDTTRTWNGLSPFGRQVVQEMNRVGIMVDISHVSDSTFYQVLEITQAPVIASHSSCRKFTPGFERNMNDDMLRKLAKNDGVIQINFGSSFLDGTISEHRDKMRNELMEIMRTQGIKWPSEEANKLVDEYTEKHRDVLFSDVEMVANHIDHVVKIAGIDHVGLGSDFDGVGDSLPAGLKDVSQYPNLIYTLLKRGYSEEDIAKVCYKNAFRVWSEVGKVARRMGS